MLPSGLTLLVLLAAVMHAAWNVMVKLSDDTLLNMGLIAGLCSLLAIATLPFVAPPATASWIFLAGSSLTHLGYYSFLTMGYRHGDLSQVYPIARGSAPLLVAIAAWAFVGETLAPLQMLGVAAISGGILSLAVDRPVDRAHNWTPILYGLATGIAIMGYTLCDGEGVRHAGDSEAQQFGYIAWVFILNSPVMVAFCFWRRRKAALRFGLRHWRLGLLASALSLLAYGIAIMAMRLGPLAHISALRETSVIFAAVMSAYLLKERFRKRRYVSVALVALGAVLLH